MNVSRFVDAHLDTFSYRFSLRRARAKLTANAWRQESYENTMVRRNCSRLAPFLIVTVFAAVYRLENRFLVLVARCVRIGDDGTKNRKSKEIDPVRLSFSAMALARRFAYTLPANIDA